MAPLVPRRIKNQKSRKQKWKMKGEKKVRRYYSVQRERAKKQSSKLYAFSLRQPKPRPPQLVCHQSLLFTRFNSNFKFHLSTRYTAPYIFHWLWMSDEDAIAGYHPGGVPRIVPFFFPSSRAVCGVRMYDVAKEKVLSFEKEGVARKSTKRNGVTKYSTVGNGESGSNLFRPQDHSQKRRT